MPPFWSLPDGPPGPSGPGNVGFNLRHVLRRGGNIRGFVHAPPRLHGPRLGVGVALGMGGLVGSYLGARAQPHLPDTLIRRVLGVLVMAIGARYAYLAVRS